MASGNKPKIKKITQHLFPKSAVKTANERLRKLETIHHLTLSSEAYQSIERFANNPNALSSKFYRFVENKDGTPGIRFITPGEYKNLTTYEQKRFNETVNSFLENNTTTKLGIEKVHHDAYDTFMENHPNLRWTYDEYMDFFDTYSKAQKDKADVIAYGLMTEIFNAPTNYSDNLTDSKIQELINYNSNEIRYSNQPSRGTFTNNKMLRGGRR